MSPRIKTIRKVLNPPVIKGFKPYGLTSDKKDIEPVNLLFEEYEALRLSDYDRLNHHHSSVMMGVSRPTFTRIYASALQKIASAFVEGRQIAINGGKVYFDSDWYHCNKCKCNFNNPDRNEEIKACPLCGSAQIESFNPTNKAEANHSKKFEALCICPHCGFEQEHHTGSPCNQMICPDCKTIMKRKGTPRAKGPIIKIL